MSDGDPGPASQAGVTAMIERYRAHVQWEEDTDYRPTTPDAVPPSAEAITPEWLTAQLAIGAPGAAVTAVHAHGGSDGTTQRREVDVTWNEAGIAAGLPARLFTKTTASFRSRALLWPMGRPENEVEFYRSYRNLMAIEAPCALHAAFDRESGRSIVIFPDMVRDGGCTFLEPGHHVDRAMAEGMVDLLARYQAFWWDHALFRAPPAWLKTTLEYQLDSNAFLPFEACSVNGIDVAAQHLPASVVARRDDLWAVHMRSIEASVQAPRTLVHFDMHVGNWYLTADGRMGLSDWSMKSGHHSSDLSYLLLSALTIEDRRAWETDLLALYRERLREHGVAEVPSAQDIALGYRRQTFHALVYWLFTIGAGAMQPDMQPDAISLANLERMGQAIEDLDSFSAIESLF